MGAPHRTDRYGETWPQYRIDACLRELESLKGLVILSGGWAWHFMSPSGHPEYKHAHDHKDVDVFVPKKMVATVIGILAGQGFEKVRTQYDGLPNNADFRRFEKTVDDGMNPSFRITIDFFVRDAPSREARGWQVTEPQFLLEQYGKIHTSSECFAVQAARKLLAQGIDPVGRSELLSSEDI
jgi:hypothetical protein